TQSACRFSVILPRNPLPDTKSACGISVQSAEKSDYASYAQALFSVSLFSPALGTAAFAARRELEYEKLLTGFRSLSSCCYPV
ncbi:hypothetical protein, partial [uncultured Ruminococcus sp.]|uniref:hypothetical protein n=1 Tax=uncultured Ruminococcus sp. TaxID=165186 RepID=UPI00266EFC12